MDPELASALEPVLHDLAGPGGLVPDIRDEPWLDAGGTASAWLYAADGSGTGIWIVLGKPAHTQIAAVADQVQEWAVEALWSSGRPTTWPPCPLHPEGHPLAAVERDGRAIWMCPATRAEITDIGALPA